MSKQKTEQFLEEVRRIAQSLGEGDESLSPEQVRAHLRESGVDPDSLKARFHQAALKLAERERLANRSVSLLLKQAIDTTRPDDRLPNNISAARAFAERWLDKFSSAFVLPANFQVSRAYRKSDDLSDLDKADLDRLEDELKQRVKKENERKA
jgi:hypothetical protein